MWRWHDYVNDFGGDDEDRENIEVAPHFEGSLENLNDVLTVTVPPKGDAWQRTHYGFRHDSAPFFRPEARVSGDFEVSVNLSTKLQERYDQAGTCALS